MWTSETALGVLRASVLLAFAVACAALGHAVSRSENDGAIVLGRRGRNRDRLRARHAPFRASELLLRKLAPLCETLTPKPVLKRIERLLLWAGEPGGLSASEIIAFSGLASIVSTSLFIAFTGPAVFGISGLLFSAFVGMFAPVMRLDALAKLRAKRLERSLPSAIDLCVLCMGAGSDFPTALAFAVAELKTGHEVCVEELSLVLEHLALGRTRVEALQGLSERATSRVVRQFVAAICQSEQKGTPLVDTLTIQANALREHRGVLAEELAARAGVQMMIPLMLMVMSLLLVIFGPFIVNGVGL